MPRGGHNRKPDALRQRRNKQPAESQLPTPEQSRTNIVPDMPGREAGWHPMVREWWTSIWQSPMASEFLDADMKGGLYLLADLHQARWDARDEPKLLKDIAAEIRLQEVRFGLSPLDRSRLRWTIEQGETAAEKTATRRKTQVPKMPDESDDPRNILKVV